MFKFDLLYYFLLLDLRLIQFVCLCYLIFRVFSSHFVGCCCDASPIRSFLRACSRLPVNDHLW